MVRPVAREAAEAAKEAVQQHAWLVAAATERGRGPFPALSLRLCCSNGTPSPLLPRAHRRDMEGKRERGGGLSTSKLRGRGGRRVGKREAPSPPLSSTKLQSSLEEDRTSGGGRSRIGGGGGADGSDKNALSI